MRLVAATLYALRIPVRGCVQPQRPRAALACDSVVVRVRDEAERRGTARGSRVRTSPARRSRRCSITSPGSCGPRVAERDLPPMGHLAGLDAFIPDTSLPGSLAPHAARAGLELAILDCSMLRRRPVGGGGPAAAAGARALQRRDHGRADGPRGQARSTDARGRPAPRQGQGRLRGRHRPGDAPSGRPWAPTCPCGSTPTAPGASSARSQVLRAVAPLGVAAVEQPLPRGVMRDYARLREAVPYR